jgi:predicted O-methyltransferase YrrM
MIKHSVYSALAGFHRRQALEQLREAERLVPSPEARFAIPFLFRGRGYFRLIRPRQNPQEIEALYRRVLKLGPRCVTEIGTARGGTLYLWAQASSPDAVLVSLDLPGGAFGGAYPPCRAPLYQAFARPGQSLHLIRDDSHRPETRERVRQCLGNKPLDFLFIDGDHTYSGVKADFEMYSSLVRPGGLIAFHDILDRPDVPGLEVHQFWSEIKTRFETSELIGSPSSGKRIGIGIVHVP